MQGALGRSQILQALRLVLTPPGKMVTLLNLEELCTHQYDGLSRANVYFREADLERRADTYPNAAHIAMGRRTSRKKTRKTRVDLRRGAVPYMTTQTLLHDIHGIMSRSSCR